MAMNISEIEELIKNSIPDANINIQDLAGDGNHYSATVSSSEFAFGIITENSWRNCIVGIKRSAEFFLAVAMSALGLNTNFRSFKSLGLKPFYFGFLVACFVGIMSLLIIQLVII